MLKGGAMKLIKLIMYGKNNIVIASDLHDFGLDSLLEFKNGIDIFGVCMDADPQDAVSQ